MMRIGPYKCTGVPGVFVISRTADWPVAIPRERTDRRYVDLERTRPIKSALHTILHAAGVIGFFGTVFALCFFR